MDGMELMMPVCMWGYITAKIEECNKRDPVPQEISAWMEMREFLEAQLEGYSKAHDRFQKSQK